MGSISGKIEIYNISSNSWETEDLVQMISLKSYDMQLEHVMECFKNQSTPCDLEDGIKTMRVLDAALVPQSSSNYHSVFLI